MPVARASVPTRIFADPKPGADEISFQVDNTSAQYYNSPYYLLHQNQIQPVPSPRTSPPRVELAEVVGDDALAPIIAAKKIVFHSVGDTGAAKVNVTQTAGTAIAHEASVADRMAQDVERGGSAGPAFFFHLGDVVYNFGEDQYYYDQFYEPFRAYDRPIFAIPGNHDGSVFGPSTAAPAVPTLTGFQTNFCASAPGASPDAGGIFRSTMDQPGVYFTLDAPFVSIIGLYTNVLEGPGVISSQGGKYALSDEQLTFLTSELERLKPARTANQCAVIIACHHPPASADAVHGGGTGLAADIDTACQTAGLWPDAVLSGHAHLYQRFTRATGGREIPFVVAGSGGFAAGRPEGKLPKAPVTVGEYTLVHDPVIAFGYLTLTVDMTTPAPELTIFFQACMGSTATDTVTVDLASGRIV